jgi:hypothetical protein
MRKWARLFTQRTNSPKCSNYECAKITIAANYVDGTVIIANNVFDRGNGIYCSANEGQIRTAATSTTRR